MEQYLIYGRDALLLMLVALLAFVLYKRLVKFLSKDNVGTAQYASIDENGLQEIDGEVICSFTLPASMRVKAEIVTDNSVIEVCNSDFEGGQHTVRSNHGLQAGRYTFRMVTNNQKLERFFRVS
ncbi:MAG: hypothetical protein GC193_15000 [Cryomorphaceae bacterium]|nr:hypothetical protein [Cryomorphaceae bacterium]